MNNFSFNVDVRVTNANIAGEPYVWLVTIYNDGGNSSGFPDAEVLVNAVDEKAAARSVMTACSVAMRLLNKPRLIEDSLREASGKVFDKCTWLRRFQPSD